MRTIMQRFCLAALAFALAMPAAPARGAATRNITTSTTISDLSPAADDVLQIDTALPVTLTVDRDATIKQIKSGTDSAQLTITGPGTLAVSGDVGSERSIYLMGAGGASLDLTGASVSADRGIYASKSITVTDSNVTAGTMTTAQYGLEADSLIVISGDSFVKAEGASFGILARDTIYARGGTVDAHGNIAAIVGYVYFDKPANVYITEPPGGTLKDLDAIGEHRGWTIVDPNLPPSNPAAPHAILKTGYTVSADSKPVGGGTAKADGHDTPYKPFFAGDNVPLTATPNAGYRFTGWTGPAGLTINNADNTSASFDMPANDVTVTANFAPLLPGRHAVNVHINPQGAGTASADVNEAASDDIVTLSATAGSGYRFVNWTGPVAFADADSPNTSFDMPDSDVTVTANFAPLPRHAVNVRVDPPEGGAASANMTTAVSGDIVTLTAELNTGYRFNGWTAAPAVTFENAAGLNTRFLMPDSDVTVTANFALSTPGTVTVTFDPQGGTVSPTSLVADADGRLPYLPTPARDGYVYRGWFTEAASGAEIRAGTVFTAAEVTLETVFTADTTVYAHWTPLKGGGGGEEECDDSAGCSNTGLGTLALLAGAAFALKDYVKRRDVL